jgi:hypothetical protein
MHESAYPSVGGEHQRTVPFSPAWLEAALNSALQAHGWVGTTEVAGVCAAVSTFLQRQREYPTLTVARIEQMVARMFSGLGYTDLAGKIRLTDPAQRISLATILGDTSPLRGEADYFVSLRATIRRSHAQGVQHLDLCNLQSAADSLSSLELGFCWDEPADLLRRKIVCFIRRELGRLRWPHPLICVIR